MKLSHPTSTRVVRIALLTGLWAAACAPAGNDDTSTGGTVTKGGSTSSSSSTRTGGTTGTSAAQTGGASSTRMGGTTATSSAQTGGTTGAGTTAAVGGAGVGGSSVGGAAAGGSNGGSNSLAGGTPAIGGSNLPTANTCPTPKTALITDFAYTSTDAGTPATEATFGDYTTTFSGGTFIYPDDAATGLASDITGSNWHIKGTVATYAGFGLFWNNCALLDASAYKGISLKISGTLPTPNTITMSVGTAEDTIATSWYAQNATPPITPTFGTCVPPTSNQYDGSCTSPAKAIPVTATPTTVTIPWADLTGGKPQASVTSSRLTGLSFYFTFSGTTAAYPVDITIDDLSFAQ